MRRHDAEYLILEPFFEAARESFLPHFPRVKHVQLFVAPEMHDTPRHFGGCRTDGRAIVLAPELASLPYPFVVGIIHHEFGHAVDYLYPGEFALGEDTGDGFEVIRRKQDSVNDTQWLRWQRAWEKREYDVVEWTADGIASAVVGEPIKYTGACDGDGPCMLQNFRLGEARPAGLR